MNEQPTFEEKLTVIRDWLGTGSINIFGLPMSGKDTVGVRLAEDLGAKFLSSGLIIRAIEKANREHLTSKGELIPKNTFYEWVLPYFKKDDLREFALILSSIGRWKGEEERTLEIAEDSGHEIKAAIILNVSEADVEARWNKVNASAASSLERGHRADDKDPEVFKKRISEFREKTLPVILEYKKLGLLIEVRANMDRDTVYHELVDRLYDFAQSA